MIDVDSQVNAVRRQVGTRVLEAGEARVVTIRQSYKATVEEVWEACTSIERIPRWFLPIKGDLQVGGRYQLDGNAEGEVLTCDPPRSFTATWEFGGEVSWIEVRITPDGDDRARFELEHIAHVDDERWSEFGPGAVGVGWDLALVGLALHLSGAPDVDPAQAEAWSMTDDGRRFITLSSDAWYEASVASGTDAAAARASADRTTAFYRGGSD